MANFPLIHLPREAWDVVSGHPRLGRWIEPGERRGVMIHHTAGRDDDSSPNVWESHTAAIARMQRLQVARPDLDLDVPYNHVAFLGRQCLWLVEGRGLYRKGDHAGPRFNVPLLGIAFAGNFELEMRADEITLLRRALASLGRWLDGLAENSRFAELWSQPPPAADETGRRVWLHRDVKATACPGARLVESLAWI